MASSRKKSKRSSRSKKSSSSRMPTILAIVIVIGFGAYYLYSGDDVLGIFTPTEEPPVSSSVIDIPGAETEEPEVLATPIPPVTTVSGEWWEVYFADPLHINDPEDWGESIEARLIDKINAAQTSIHIASFEFDLTPVAEALITAKNRGVEIQWVTDDEHGLESDEEPGHGQFAMLEEAGIEIRGDDRSALMHNKFWIFDGEWVWTGSTNITVNGIFKQNNNVIAIRSPELAQIYEREFQEMWNGEFGPRSTSQLADQSVIVNDSPIQVIFTSEDQALEEAIIPIVSAAESSVRFMAFAYTDYPLAAAMIDRANNGVDVAGVFEKVGSSTDAAELKTLHCAGVPARRDGNPSFLHHKVVIVDESIVMTGSLNFSTNAETRNDENVLIIENPEIAALYMQEFERVWAQATDPEPEKFPCE